MKLKCTLKNSRKSKLIKFIACLFEDQCVQLMKKTNVELLSLSSSKYDMVNCSRLLAAILEEDYGTAIFLSLCKPHDSQLNIDFTTPCHLSWLCSVNDYPLIPCQILNSAEVKNIIMQLHPSHRLLLRKNFSENSIILVSAFFQHSQIWSQYTENSLLCLILCYSPFAVQFPFSRELMISDVLCYEFGHILYRFLTRDHGVSYYTQTAQDIQHAQQTDLLEPEIEHKKHIVENWPQCPTSTVIMECLRNYRIATCYSQPLVCVSCGRAQHNVSMHFVSFNHENEPSLNLKKLTVTDPYLLQRLNTNLENDIHYDFSSLNGLILCKNGMRIQNDKNTIELNFCEDCHSALSRNKCLGLH